MLLTLLLLAAQPAGPLCWRWLTEVPGHAGGPAAEAATHGAGRRLQAAPEPAATAATAGDCMSLRTGQRRPCGAAEAPGPTGPDTSWIVISALQAGLGMLFFAAVGFVYKALVTNRRDPFPDPVPAEYSLSDKGFKHGTLGCCGDIHYLLYGCCCLPCRVSDTFDAAAVASYWQTFASFVALWFAAPLLALLVDAMLPSAWFLRAPLWLALELRWAKHLAQQRKVLRQRLGDKQPEESFWSDLFCFCCCLCCTAIQDARQVDGASGVAVRCCCKLQQRESSVASGDVVGLAVAVREEP